MLEKLRNIDKTDFPPDLGSLVFTGNPGTGKTSIAHLYSQALWQLGYLKKGHLVAVDMRDLVAGYLGQTALMTRGAVERALDGTFYVDEAHQLISAGDYGREAIDTLISLMEEYKDRILFVFSGYPENMREFLELESGLRERIAHIVHFPDYSVQELIAILEIMASQSGFNILAETKKKLESYLEAYLSALASKGQLSGNARLSRNLLASMEAQSAARIVRENIDIQARPNILPEDIPLYLRN